jgi:hypothetical protein
MTLVKPGRYRFHAFIRTVDITTDQGIRFRVSDAEVSARSDTILGQFAGTYPRSDIEHDVIVPSKPSSFGFRWSHSLI